MDQYKEDEYIHFKVSRWWDIPQNTSPFHALEETVGLVRAFGELLVKPYHHVCGDDYTCIITPNGMHPLVKGYQYPPSDKTLNRDFGSGRIHDLKYWEMEGESMTYRCSSSFAADLYKDQESSEGKRLFVRVIVREDRYEPFIREVDFEGYAARVVGEGNHAVPVLSETSKEDIEAKIRQMESRIDPEPTSDNYAVLGRLYKDLHWAASFDWGMPTFLERYESYGSSIRDICLALFEHRMVAYQTAIELDPLNIQAYVGLGCMANISVPVITRKIPAIETFKVLPMAVGAIHRGEHIIIGSHSPKEIVMQAVTGYHQAHGWAIPDLSESVIDDLVKKSAA